MGTIGKHGKPHPWRKLRDQPHITLKWAVLPPGVFGFTDLRTHTITMAHGLDQAERRCTIAHELEHIARGVPHARCLREEAAIDRHVARYLLPAIKDIGEELAWSTEMDEVASGLWVDRPTLHARLTNLHPAERAYLHRRLAEL